MLANIALFSISMSAVVFLTFCIMIANDHGYTYRLKSSESLILLFLAVFWPIGLVMLTVLYIDRYGK